MLSASPSALLASRVLLIALAFGLSAPALAAGTAPLPLPAHATPTVAETPAEPPLRPDVAPPPRPMVWIDWHGDLRMRAERLSGVRLFFPTSPVGAPARLDLQHSTDEKGYGSDGVMATADLRLRFDPVLHVGEWFEVRGQFDLAQGLVMGGNSDVRLAGSGYDSVEMFTSQSGQGPVPGGIQVRRLWLHARLFGLAELDIGRQPDHFGMGMLRNSGGDMLGDFQSDVDRVSLRGELFGLRLMLARDSLSAFPSQPSGTSSGISDAAIVSGGAAVQTGTGAVQYPLEDATDVTRYVLQVEGGKPGQERGLEWGAALLWTTQTLGSALEHDTTTDLKTKLATDSCFSEGTCVGLVPRNASFLTPQVALDWRTAGLGHKLRLQAEGVFLYGTIGQTDVLTQTSSAKTLVSGGLAARGTWSLDRSDVILDTGFASGESEGGFGVNDTNNFTRKVDDSQRSLLTGFHFHRNFRIDGILFRDVIGAVANAVYFKPAYRYHLLGGPASSEALSVEGSVVTAIAASAAATPGGGSLLGVEPGLDIAYRQGPRSGGMLRGSVLLPGGAFDDPITHASAHTAWRLEAVWRLAF